jgi:hypothetical protein
MLIETSQGPADALEGAYGQPSESDGHRSRVAPLHLLATEGKVYREATADLATFRRARASVTHFPYPDFSGRVALNGPAALRARYSAKGVFLLST